MKIQLKFWYHAHFNLECEPFSYLCFYGTGNERHFIQPKPTQVSASLESRLLQGEITHQQYLDENAKSISKTSDTVILSYPDSVDTRSLLESSLIVYLFANTYVPVGKSWQRSVERRTDELILPWSEASIQESKFGYGHSSGYLSAQRKFSLVLLWDESFVLDDNGQEKMSITQWIQQIRPEQRDKIRQKRKKTRERLHQITLKLNEEFFRLDLDFSYDKIRICNTSYVYFPTTTSIVSLDKVRFPPPPSLNQTTTLKYSPNITALPGWAFVTQYERTQEWGSREFYEHLSKLACIRMKLLMESGSVLSDLSIKTIGEWIVETCAWPVRMATYMNDTMDVCSPLNTEKTSTSTSASVSSSTTAETKVNETEGFVYKIKNRDKNKTHLHQIVQTDQFASLWNGVHPARSADDCESFVISCYLLIRGLMHLFLHSSSATTNSRFLKPLQMILEYTPVVATVTILNKGVDQDTDFENESSSEEKTQGSRSLYNGQSHKDPRLICHVVLLLIPTIRLHCWLKRGADHRQGKLDTKHSVNCKWPNLLVDATDYAASQQDKGSSLSTETETEKQTNLKQIEFITLFNRSFPHASAFLFKIPETVTQGWKTYVHAIDGLSDQTGRDLGYPHFVFFNTETKQRAVRFADLMANNGVHDSADSYMACLPIGDPVSDQVYQDLQCVLQDEPLPRVPPFSPVQHSDPLVTWQKATRTGNGTSKADFIIDLEIKTGDWNMIKSEFETWIRSTPYTYFNQKYDIYDGLSYLMISILKK